MNRGIRYSHSNQKSVSRYPLQPLDLDCSFTSFFGAPSRYQAQRWHNPKGNQQDSVPALEAGGRAGSGKNCTNNYVIFLTAKGYRRDTQRCGHSGENLLSSFPQSSPTSTKKDGAKERAQQAEITKCLKSYTLQKKKKKSPICCYRSQRDVTPPAK